MKPLFNTIIFDFDYTLADSSAGVVTCVNFALHEMDLPTVPPEKIYPTIGLSLPETLRQLTGIQTTEKNIEFSRLFIQKAEKVMVDSTKIFETVPDTIRRLKEQGISLAIVSTKFRYRIEAILRREKLLKYFDVIVGGEDVDRHKPDPEGLLLALEKLRFSPAESVYVGDSIVDAQTARSAGLPFIAVLSGATPRDAFIDHDVFHFLESIRDLPEFLRP